MGIYDGRIDPPLPEIAECPECEQMHSYWRGCPVTPLAQTKVHGVDIVTSEIQAGHAHTVICGGTWDCVAGDNKDVDKALRRHDQVVEWVHRGMCHGADDEPDCSHCPYRP